MERGASKALSQSGLVALQDAGTTQEDGFSDCAEASRAHGGLDAGLRGFCFYTRQDLNRAKRTSQLTLAFWRAPDGAPQAMSQVGEHVVDAFRKNGFLVDWNGTPARRLTAYLQNIGRKHDWHPAGAASAASAAKPKPEAFGV